MTVLAVLTPTGPELRDPATPLITAEDPGLLRGESVFETVRIGASRPAFADRHLARLAVSAERLEMAVPEGLEALVACAARAWEPPDGVLRIVCTRGGVAFALVTAMPARPESLEVVTLRLGGEVAARRQPWQLAGVKSTSYAVNMAAQRFAVTQGAQDAVFVSGDGEVLEGPTSTVMWVTGGVLCSPPADEVGILPGTTAEVLHGLTGSDLRRGTLDDLLAADEILMASSIRGVTPVVRLDDRRLPVGTVTAHLREAFERLVTS